MTAAELIAKFEGFASKAYWDVNHWRVGYGSDTEGVEQFNVVRETTTTRSRALDNLTVRIPEFQKIVIAKIGNDAWMKLNDDQRSALTSVAYNYGRLPVDVYLSNPARTADQIRALKGHNGGINRERRLAEANFYQTGTLDGKQTGMTPATTGGIIIAAGTGTAGAAAASTGELIPALVLVAFAVISGVFSLFMQGRKPSVAKTEVSGLSPLDAAIEDMEAKKRAYDEARAVVVGMKSELGQSIADLQSKMRLIEEEESKP